MTNNLSTVFKTFLFFLSFFTVLAAQNSELKVPNISVLPEPPLTQEKMIQELVHQNNLFALKLYTSLQKETTGNISFSPYNISSAMMMAYLGAEEQTKTEIGEVFRFEDQVDLEKNFAFFNTRLTRRYSDTPNDFGLFVANSIWLANRLTVLPEYITKLNQYSRGIFRRVDFNQKEVARAEINSWVRENTHGKIREILSSADLSLTTKLVLVSSLYFKAKWSEVFYKQNTRLQPFYANDESLIIPLMSTTSTFPFYEDESVSILEMPYVHPNPTLPKLSMLVFLPHDKQGLPAFEKELILDRLEYWIPSLNSEKVLVTLPRFTVESSFSLKDTLTKMGMPNAFADNADFSKITGNKDLKIGNVIHKTFVAVDESGTEAAGATAITMTMKSSFFPGAPKIFKADHPFMFMIIEKTTGAILFMGRVINPTSTH